MLGRQNGDSETLVRDEIGCEGWVCLESRSTTEGSDAPLSDSIGAEDTVSLVLCERKVAPKPTQHTIGTSEADDPRRGELQNPSASPHHLSARCLILAEQDDPLCRIAGGISIPHHNEKPPPRKRKRRHADASQAD